MISRHDILKLQDLPIEQVAEDLGLHVARHTAICPFHDDTRPSLTFNTRRNRYRCYVCDAHGGVIDLVMHTLGKDFREACRWLGADNEDRVERHCYAPRARNPEPEAKPDIEYLQRLMCQPVLNAEARKFLFEERMIAPEVVTSLGISSISYSCPMSSSPKPTHFDGPALLIPYRDIDGKLISVQSRYLGQEGKPRFRFPKGSTCHVFNLDSLARLRPQDPMFITEGVTDCLAILSAGLPSVAIPSATLLKPTDLEALRGHPLHMYPDRDAPGEKLFLELKALFPTIVHHSLPEGFKDIGQYWAHIKSKM